MYSNTLTETTQYKNYTIELHYDTDTQDNYFDMLDTNIMFVCWHRRYNLGNTDNDFPDVESFQEWLKDNPAIVYPLYMYEHSGITIHMAISHIPYPFNDCWDSGKLGYVVYPLANIRKDFKCKHVSYKTREKAVKCMQSETENYDSYLRGEVYGFIVKDEQGEELDSCWGFIGDSKYPMQEAKDYIEWHIEQAEKEQQELFNRVNTFAMA